MNLLENNLIYIIIIVLFFLLLNLYRNRNNDKMADIERIFDPESIKNLDNLSNTLLNSGLTIPGNLKVNGIFSSGNNLIADNNNLLVNGSRIILGNDWTIYGDNQTNSGLWFSKTKSNKPLKSLALISTQDGIELNIPSIKLRRAFSGKNIQANISKVNVLNTKNAKLNKTIANNVSIDNIETNVIGSDSYYLGYGPTNNRCGSINANENVGKFQDIFNDCFLRCPPNSIMIGMRLGKEYDHKFPICKKLY